MGNSELAIRFTETTYATKNEVSKELKMSLIDNIWSDILSYRGNFYRYLTIRAIDRSMFAICLCPSINNHINSINADLLKINRDYSRLGIDNGDLKHFETAVRVRALKVLADSYNLDASENYLRSLINGTIQETNDDFAILFRYNRALNFIKDKCTDPLDADYLRNLYSEVVGHPVSNRFYRTNRDENPLNRVIIDRIYTSAPVENIELMMNNLFTFLEKSDLSGLVKSIITYFYISYIRPFDTYSDEVALLMMKAVLAHFDLYEFGVALPLEDLFNRELKELNRVSIEVQKTHDITYFVNYVLRFFDAKTSETADILINRQVRELKNEMYQEDKPAVKVPPMKKEEILQHEEVKEEIKKPVEVKKEEKVVEEAKEEEPRPQEEIAIGYIPPALDEKQAQRLEVHLLELDPSLKKGEAKFYARHCTMGKSYTIQQYKKAIGCVYETARTSMEHLVSLGYYRRDLVNNKKYVYTPISRK